MNSEKTPNVDQYLRRAGLEIQHIIYLARGVDPLSVNWSPRGVWRSRVQDLWIAVEEEELPAVIAGPAFTGIAWVKLIDLRAYLTRPKQLNNRSWDWARVFCQKWEKAAGATLASPDKKANAGTVDAAISGARNRRGHHTGVAGS